LNLPARRRSHSISRLRRAAFFERVALLGTRRLELPVALLEMLLRVPQAATRPRRRTA
jgi:hypothetical protein